MKRCKICVLPEIVTGFSDGVCPFCLSYEPKKRKGERALIKIFEYHKKRGIEQGRKYDCMILVSGGKDSISALYYIVKNYKMKVLAYHYDNGFTDTQAEVNLKKAVEVLNVDLIVNKNNKEQKRYFKYNISNLLSQYQSGNSIGSLASLLCVGCSEGYLNSAYKIAKKYGIKLIIVGGNPVEPDLQFFYTPYKNQFVQFILKPISEVLTNPFFWNIYYYKKFYSYLHISVIKKQLVRKIHTKVSKTMVVHFYDFIEWDESEIIYTLENKLGWRRPPNRSSTSRFDCKIHMLLDSIRKKSWGFSEKDVTYSNMIRENMISRDEAIRRIETETKEEDKCRDGIVEEIVDEVDMIDALDKVKKLYST